MKARWTMAVVCAMAIAVVVAGCGGGGNTGSSSNESSGSAGGEGGVTTSSLSKAEFIKESEEACEKERKSLVDEASRYLEKHGKEKLAEGVLVANMAKAVMVPTIEAEIAAVRALGAPEGEEEEVEAMLTAQEAAVAEVKELKKAETIQDVEALFADAAKKYEAYGFEACRNSS